MRSFIFLKMKIYISNISEISKTVKVLDPHVAAEKDAATTTVNENPKPPGKPAEKNEEDLESAGIKGAKAGQNLREGIDALIKLKGSVAETARSLGVSASTVNNWKNGKTPKKEMIAKIKRAVGRLTDDKSRTDDTGDTGSQGPE